MTTALSQLTDHEATIERGLKTFVDVGNALAAIRDGNLYRADHATFEDYCKARWIEAPRQGHSVKPAVFRHTVERVSPGPRIELFARQASPGWTAWGNQVEAIGGAA